MDTLDVFYPERMAQRILGMGEITSLVKKPRNILMKRGKKIRSKIRKKKFDLRILKCNWSRSKKWQYERLLGMIPGVGKKIKD